MNGNAELLGDIEVLVDAPDIDRHDDEL